MRPLIAVLASGLVACATGDGTDHPLDSVGSTWRGSFDPVASSTTVHGTLRRVDGIHEGDAALAMRDGTILVRRELAPDRDDQLVIEALELAYADVVLPAYFGNVHALTDIVVRLENPLRGPAHQRGDGMMWTSATTDLQLDWSARLDSGETYALASQTLTALDVTIVMTNDEGTLGIVRPDVMWSWFGDVITLGDAAVVATAYPAID